MDRHPQGRCSTGAATNYSSLTPDGHRDREPYRKGLGLARNGPWTSLEGVLAGLTGRQSLLVSASERSEPQRAARVTRRAGAQRRTAEPLTWPTAKAIWGCLMGDDGDPSAILWRNRRKLW